MKPKNTKKQQKGFTVIEVLVVVAIIGLLASIVLTNLSTAKSRGRDAKRKSDMIQIRTALELYFNEHNSYPITSGEWRGTSVNNGSFDLVGLTGYIPELAPAFMTALPMDPSGDTTEWSGYAYRSDNGKDYKLLNSAVGPESWPAADQLFYDPCRPGTAWMLTNNPDVTANPSDCGGW